MTPTINAAQAMTDEQIRDEWRKAGGGIHGPNVETVTMPERLYFQLRRDLLAVQPSQAQAAEAEHLRNDLHTLYLRAQSCDFAEFEKSAHEFLELAPQPLGKWTITKPKMDGSGGYETYVTHDAKEARDAGMRGWGVGQYLELTASPVASGERDSILEDVARMFEEICSSELFAPGYAAQMVRQMQRSILLDSPGLEARNVDGMTRAEFEKDIRYRHAYDNIIARERGHIQMTQTQIDADVKERVERNYPTPIVCPGCHAFDSGASEVHFVRDCAGCIARMQQIAGFGPLVGSPSPIANEREDLTEAQREKVRDAIVEALGDAYDCTRVWSAWSYGTMGPNDFSLVSEDDDRLGEITDAAIRALLRARTGEGA